MTGLQWLRNVLPACPELFYSVEATQTLALVNPRETLYIPLPVDGPAVIEFMFSLHVLFCVGGWDLSGIQEATSFLSFGRC